MEGVLMPMSKNGKTLMTFAKGGVNQTSIATVPHVSKRDVSAGEKAIRECVAFDDSKHHGRRRSE